jgi:outer membrane protein
MKKTALITALALFTTLSVFGQRFAYIDSDYILENIPEYQAAQMQLNELSVQWQNEIEAKFGEIDELYRKYQAESVLLPEEMKRQREEEIVAKERAAKELQMQRFGRDGDLFKRREELIKPLQDQIYDAVEQIATRGNYAVIFDKSGGGNMIFSDVRYDLSDEVLQRMGYRN